MTARVKGRTPRASIVRTTTVIALVAILDGGLASPGVGQGQTANSSSQRLTIPFLANATKRADLDFTAAECDISNGEQMACRFRQVFLTIPSSDPTTCVITTNGYERTFRLETGARWISQSAPMGDCGIVETTMLVHGGGNRWTMTIQAAATLKADQPECRAGVPEPEVYDGLNIKRKLPCTSIQPGAIER